MTMTSSRLTLTSLCSHLISVSTEQLKFVHSIFMDKFINYDDYEFSDEWMLDNYLECFNEWFNEGGNTVPYELNGYVCDILHEWKENSPSRYKRAMQTIKSSLNYSPTNFKSVHAASVSEKLKEIYREANDNEIVQALQPFAGIALKHVQSKEYIEAASLLFLLFEEIGKVRCSHEDWFSDIYDAENENEVQPFTEALHDLYCHLRQMRDLPAKVAFDMDVYLVSSNRHYKLFDDLELGDSSDTYSYDMICSAKDQDGDYTTLPRDIIEYLRG